MDLTISFNSNVYDLGKMIKDIPDYVLDFSTEIANDYSILVTTISYNHEGNILLWATKYFNPTEHRDEFRVPYRDLTFSFSTDEEKDAIIENRFTVLGVNKSWAYIECNDRIIFKIPY